MDEVKCEMCGDSGEIWFPAENVGGIIRDEFVMKCLCKLEQEQNYEQEID